MKNFSFVFILSFVGFSIGFIHSCKKEAGSSTIPPTTPPASVITISFVEEFEDITSLTTTSDWVKKNNSADENDYGLTDWGQGMWSTDKLGNEYGFPAYSYSSFQNEYVYSGQSYASISSWLITPVLSVKNGDKISFYTRTDSNYTYTTDRMQVLMNKSTSTDVGSTPNSVGSFTTTLFDINSTQSQGGYPPNWKKYEYTFSGISGKMNTRIAFRHYDPGTTGTVSGIGIDLFKFEVK
jgi:hypothetical protein